MPRVVGVAVRAAVKSAAFRAIHTYFIVYAVHGFDDYVSAFARAVFELYGIVIFLVYFGYQDMTLLLIYVICDTTACSFIMSLRLGNIQVDFVFLF